MYNDTTSHQSSIRKKRRGRGAEQGSSGHKRRNPRGPGGPQSDPRGGAKGVTNEHKIKNEDLENVAALFDCVKLLILENTNLDTNSLEEQLKSHIKKIMVDLQLTLKPSMHPSIKATHNLKARFALYEIVFVKLIEFAKIQNPKVGEVLEELHDSHSYIFKGLLDVIFEIEPKTDKLYANYRERNRKAYEETNDALQSADRLFEENQKIIADFEQEQRDWEIERTRYLQEIQNLESENKKYLNMILRHSKGMDWFC